MGSGEWGVGGDERGQGRIYFPSPLSLLYPQCPMPHAQCPMPNAQCPMLNAQSTFLQEYSMPLASIVERDNQ
ncbi:MAG: hypothetical protein V7L04_12690 [Nostoc sp.]|uniref:hypothetical protein n=1 Tax=Nostoc sp. TaxID=1180 RepID=UPI002FF6C7F4